jgi:hypothetical protein
MDIYRNFLGPCELLIVHAKFIIKMQLRQNINFLPVYGHNVILIGVSNIAQNDWKGNVVWDF